MFKTMTIVTFFSVLILLMMYLFQILYSNLFYEQNKINEVKRIVKNLESNSDKIETYLNKVTNTSDICIEYVLSNGSILYNENTKGCILDKPNDKIKELKSNMFNNKNKELFYTINNPLFNSKSYLYGVHLSNGTYIFINSQLESLDNTYLILKNQLIYLVIIVIILSIILSYFVSNAITKPILDITKKAKKMGNGNMNVNFDKSDILEIDELSETLNFAKNEMIKTDDYRRDLMANVGHDLKTPLTLIKSYAEMVRDINYNDKEKREANLNVIISETDRLNDLVNDILTLSKMEANADTLNIEKYDLIAEIKTIIEKFKILSETENYKFILTSPNKAAVQADKKKINQVIYNLINNAINYTGDDLCIYINVKEVKKEYLVEIRDTGKGIDTETIKHIWDRYYKTEKKHKRNKVGTGLGLSIVKSILESHSFEYGVRSNINAGTVFYFTIKKNNIK